MSKLFTEVTLNRQPLSNCQCVYKSSDDNQRLYMFDERPNHKLVYFIALDFISCQLGVDDWWLNPTLEVDEYFTATVMWDGVCHLEFDRENNEDMPGYIYYPSMSSLIAMLQIVNETHEQFVKEAGV